MPEPGIKLLTCKQVYYVTIFFFQFVFAHLSNKSMLKIRGERERKKEREFSYRVSPSVRRNN